MNAVTTSEANSALPVTMGFGDLASFEFLQKSAKAFASSTMVPAAYQARVQKGYGDNVRYEDNPAALSNCMIALDMAQRMSANPLMIMQNLYPIEGKPSWSSQFIIAAINNCGKFSPLRFDLEWMEEMDASYSTFEWSQQDRKKVEKKQTVRIKNARCVAWALEKATGQRIESAPVTMEMAVNEGWYGKNGSKWRSMPDLMLRYRSAAFFGRIYAPELLMGLPTAEEVQDVFVQDTEGNVTHAGPRVVPKSMGPAEVVEPEEWPADRWAAGLAKWVKGVANGKPLDEVLTWLQSKGKVTPAQEKQLRDEVAKLQQPAAEAATGAPQVDPEKLAADMQACTDLDKLYELAGLIEVVTDEAAALRLNEIFAAKQAELEQP